MNNYPGLSIRFCKILLLAGMLPWLAACSRGKLQSTPTPESLPSTLTAPAATPILTATPTPTPPVSSTATPRPAPTSTHTRAPSPTHTPSPSPAVWSIRPDTARQLVPVKRLSWTAERPNYYSRPSFLADSQTLAIKQAKNDVVQINLWNILDEALVNHLDDNGIGGFSYSPVRQLIATVNTEGGIRLWSIPSGNLVRTICQNSSNNSLLAFSADGQYLASFADDIGVSIWRVQDGSLANTIEIHEDSTIMAMGMSPDWQLLGAGLRNGNITLWRVSDASVQFQLTGHTGAVTSLAFSPDGQQLVSGSDDNSIRIWQVSSGKLIKAISAHQDWISDLAFSPDGQVLASASQDTTVKLWDGSNWELLQTLSAHQAGVHSLSFSPDGALLASTDTFGSETILWGRAGWLSQATPAPTAKKVTTPTPTQGPTIDPAVGEWQCLDADPSGACRPPFENLIVRAFALADEDDLWAVTKVGAVLHWNGSAWTQDINTGAALNDILFLSPQNGWIVGEGKQVLHWNGRTWAVSNPYRASQYPCCGYRLQRAAFSDPSHGWAFGSWDSEGGGGAYGMQWDGARWKEIDPVQTGLQFLGNFARKAVMLSATDGWLFTDAGLSRWNGQQWGGQGTPVYPISGDILSSEDVWVGGSSDSGYAGRHAVIAHWDGQAWEQNSVPEDLENIRLIKMLSRDDGWAMGLTGHPLDDFADPSTDQLLHWNGVEWVKYPLTVQNSAILDFETDPAGGVWAMTIAGALLHLAPASENPAQPMPTPWAACPDAPLTRLWVGGFAFVNPEPPIANRLRSQPGTANPAAGSILPGQAMEILEGPQCADGLVWWKVRSLATGITGWTAEGDAEGYWLVPCSSANGCGKP